MWYGFKFTPVDRLVNEYEWRNFWNHIFIWILFSSKDLSEDNLKCKLAEAYEEREKFEIKSKVCFCIKFFIHFCITLENHPRNYWREKCTKLTVWSNKGRNWYQVKITHNAFVCSKNMTRQNRSVPTTGHCMKTVDKRCACLLYVWTNKWWQVEEFQHPFVL